MFSFKRCKLDPSALLCSQLFDERAFYKTFVSDLKRCQNQVVIESPYLSCRRANQLAPVLRMLVKKGVKVRINTRNPNHHDQNLRIQGWKVFYQFKDLGIKVKLCDDMRHRKLAVLDECVLWEGSLNILSQSNSREVMRRIQSPELCRQMTSFTVMNKWFW
jgi:hypothetical protein